MTNNKIRFINNKFLDQSLNKCVVKTHFMMKKNVLYISIWMYCFFVILSGISSKQLEYLSSSNNYIKLKTYIDQTKYQGNKILFVIDGVPTKYKNPEYILKIESLNLSSVNKINTVSAKKIYGSVAEKYQIIAIETKQD